MISSLFLGGPTGCCLESNRVRMEFRIIVRRRCSSPRGAGYTASHGLIVCVCAHACLPMSCDLHLSNQIAPMSETSLYRLYN